MTGGPESLLLYFLLIITGAKIGGEASQRLGQPAVLGELLVGILLGPSLLGILPSFELLDHAEQSFEETTGTDGNVTGDASLSQPDFVKVQDLKVLAALAELGVLILLFEVGLESSLREFRRVGVSAGLVGTYGVVFSLFIGAGFSWFFATQFDWVLTETAQAQPHMLHIFIGATLAATSVGITARVLKELGKIRTKESQIILGAAVFDDVLGLIVLAIVGGLVVNPGALSALGVVSVFAKALGFFFLAILIGAWIAPRLIEVVHRAFRTEYIHLAVAVVVMLAASWLATVAGLAAIVGAFAGGLALSGSPHRHVIFETLRPVGSLLVGFFFVVLGARVDLSHVTPAVLPLVLLVGGVLTVAGILGKLLCGLGVVRTNASRWVVGIGMVPRGEVGLIFALFGLEHDLLTNWQYSTIIIVVMLTTLVTPFWLKAVAGRFRGYLEEPPNTARVEQVVEP